MNLATKLKNQLLTSRMIFMLAAAIFMGGFLVANNALAYVECSTPNGTITSPDNNSVVNGTAYFTTEANGSVKYYYTNDDGSTLIGNGSYDGDGDYNGQWDTTGVVDGTYNIYAVVSGCDDQKFQTDPITVIVDNNPPSVTSAIATASTTVVITFDKELLNNPSTHQPTPEDFIIYHSGDSSSIDISSTTYADKVVTLTLAEPLVAGDNPTYVVVAPSQDTRTESIVDLNGVEINKDLSGSIIDGINPVITLNGSSTVTLDFGAEYRDAGASCSDVWAGDLDIIVSGDTVNTGAAGTYNINYDCLDNDGNEANQISRTVIVNPQPAPVQTGGGGSSHPPYCTAVAYGAWGACVNGIQTRTISNLTNNYCLFTNDQKAAELQACTLFSDNGSGQSSGGTSTTTPPTNPGQSGSGKVLGVKIYPIGSLLRTPDHKIYVITSTSTVKYIPDQKTLRAYRGHEIFNVSYETLAFYKQVLGVKIYADGTLLRGPDLKIYVIINGKKHHVLDLAELAEYFGHRIINVSADVLAQY